MKSLSRVSKGCIRYGGNLRLIGVPETWPDGTEKGTDCPGHQVPIAQAIDNHGSTKPLDRRWPEYTRMLYKPE